MERRLCLVTGDNDTELETRKSDIGRIKGDAYTPSLNGGSRQSKNTQHTPCLPSVFGHLKPPRQVEVGCRDFNYTDCLSAVFTAGLFQPGHRTSSADTGAISIHWSARSCSCRNAGTLATPDSSVYSRFSQNRVPHNN